jgi:hypothetical protein
MCLGQRRMLHQILMKVFYTLAWKDVPTWLYMVTLFAQASASNLPIEKPGQQLLLGTGRARRMAPIPAT